MGSQLSCSVDSYDLDDLDNNMDYCSSSTFGLDYFDFVNDNIKSILYPKQNTPKSQIKQLNEIDGTKIFTITNVTSNIKTCVCEIKPKPNAKFEHVLIFSHGNGCDIYTFYNYLKLLAENLNVLVVSYDYPTYGLSKGELNETTCSQALSDVVSHYLKSSNKILLVGQSLGTGIVIDYASKNSWQNPIILISPYKSIPKVITESSILEMLVSKHKYASYQKISKCVCKIKIFHGISDQIIDISHGMELHNLSPNTFPPSWLENTDHNNILEKINYGEYRKILQFI